MNKKGEVNIWIILILIAVAFFLFKGQLFATFSNIEYKDLIWRPIFPYPRDYGLSDSGIIKLPEGTNLSNIYSMSIELKGCSLDSEAQAIVNVLDNFYTFSFPNCDFLTFPDKGGEQSYIHYQAQAQSINIPFGLKSSQIPYIFSKGNNKILDQKIVVNEYVSCTRSSQCPIIIVQGTDVQSQCDQSYHKCSFDLALLKEGYGQEKIVYVDRYISENPDAEIKSNINWLWVLIGVVSVLAVVFLLTKK